MRETIVTTEISRERGYIYFVGTDDKGFITIERTKSGRRKKKV